jgi:hypothetical protein
MGKARLYSRLENEDSYRKSESLNMPSFGYNVSCWLFCLQVLEFPAVFIVIRTDMQKQVTLSLPVRKTQFQCTEPHFLLLTILFSLFALSL